MEEQKQHQNYNTFAFAYNPIPPVHLQFHSNHQTFLNPIISPFPTTYSHLTMTRLLSVLIVLLCFLSSVTSSSIHRIRMKGTHEEQVKAEARNQAEKDKAQREVNEAEEKRIAVENEPAIEQEKENEKFIDQCVGLICSLTLTQLLLNTY